MDKSSKKQTSLQKQTKKSIVALGSGQGSTIDFFCQQSQKKDPVFYIKAIVTDNPKSRLIKIAQRFKIPCHILSYNKQNPELWNEKLCHLLTSYDPSLIVLAGFLKKLGSKIIETFPDKIINSHPSLLPEFGGAGFYGLKVHQAVLSEGRRETGISIHLVNSEYDKGRILDQLVIPIKENETAEELQKRVKEKEKLFYLQTLLSQ